MSISDKESELQEDEMVELKELDPGMISQVFSNVISNAIKYSSKERSQKVHISYKEESETYLVAMRAHDGEIFAESEEGVGSTFYLRFKKQSP